MSLQYLPPAIYIVLGIVYLGVSIGLKKQDCDSALRIYGIITGVLYFSMGVLSIVNTQLNNNYVNMASFAVAIGLVATLLWGLWLLLGKSGLECRLTNKSQLWIGLMILQLITLPLLTGVGSLIYLK